MANDEVTEDGGNEELPFGGDDEKVDVDEGSPDWDAIETPELTPEDYLKGTTEEYKGLAEEIERASTEEWEMQAVAASLPGVESGLVTFDDVSGTESVSEESYEAIEQAASSDLTMRVGTALIIFGLFLGSLVLGGWWFTAFVTLVMVVGLGELYATLRSRGYRPLALFGLLGVLFVGIGAHNAGASAIGGWVAGTTIVIILFYSLAQRRDSLANMSVTIVGMAWVAMLAFAILIARGANPIANIFFLVLVVAGNDIGAYFAGKGFGRHKLAPAVSPSKTVEGFVGGLVVSVLLGALLAVFPPWEHISVSQAILIALLASVMAPIGDLVESMVKRTLDVKDMGSVLPGHGGMLDRIDGFLFAAPAIYVLLRGFGLL